jgi:hypothetical protein
MPSRYSTNGARWRHRWWLEIVGLIKLFLKFFSFLAKDYIVEKVDDDVAEMRPQLDSTIEDTNVMQFVVFRNGSKSKNN